MDTWKDIADIIFDISGINIDTTHPKQIYGGDINRAFLLAGGKQRYIIKINKVVYYSHF